MKYVTYIDREDLERMKRVSDGSSELKHICMWSHTAKTKRYELTIRVKEVEFMRFKERLRGFKARVARAWQFLWTGR